MFMRIVAFGVHGYDRPVLEEANAKRSYEIEYLDVCLNRKTVGLAQGFDVVSATAGDILDALVLGALKKGGTNLIALRAAGFNNVDLTAAKSLEIRVVRVPQYSPYAVAEFATALLLALNRNLQKSFYRIRDLNFSLDGLVGFDLHGKTVGVFGTGKIGSVFTKIMGGFGCQVLAFDPTPNPELAGSKYVKYTTPDEIYARADIISLHVPLKDATRHLLDAAAFAKMKPNVLIINTGRGGLIDTKALVAALKRKTIGGAALDVYEEEEGVYNEDHSGSGIDDDLLARLLTFPNVLMTSHQGFLTKEALHNIAETTFENIDQFKRGEVLTNEIISE
jgi:D-lactate dehydrogenase